jgi:hypothetical protein
VRAASTSYRQHITPRPTLPPLKTIRTLCAHTCFTPSTVRFLHGKACTWLLVAGLSACNDRQVTMACRMRHIGLAILCTAVAARLPARAQCTHTEGKCVAAPSGSGMEGNRRASDGVTPDSSSTPYVIPSIGPKKAVGSMSDTKSMECWARLGIRLRASLRAVTREGRMRVHARACSKHSRWIEGPNRLHAELVLSTAVAVMAKQCCGRASWRSRGPLVDGRGCRRQGQALSPGKSPVPGACSFTAVQLVPCQQCMQGAH